MNHTQTDGLNTLKYRLKEIEMKRTFTRILVDFVPEEVIICPEKYIKLNMVSDLN